MKTPAQQLLEKAQERRALAKFTPNIAFAKLLIREADELERQAANLTGATTA